MIPRIFENLGARSITVWFPCSVHWIPSNIIPYTSPSQIRNVAIIAHVDHGKTTLVDGLLRQSASGEKLASTDRVMDSNALEQVRVRV